MLKSFKLNANADAATSDSSEKQQQQQQSQHQILWYTLTHDRPNQSNAFQSHLKSIHIATVYNIRRGKRRLVPNTFQTVNFRLCRASIVFFPHPPLWNYEPYISIFYTIIATQYDRPNVICAQSQFEMVLFFCYSISFTRLIHWIYKVKQSVLL